MKTIDLTGNRYGNLTVIRKVESQQHPGGKKSATWECRCDCGKIINVIGCNLKSGHSKSCGCKERPARTHGDGRKKKARLYVIWSNMRQRCSDKNLNSYKNYGGRGIRVCKEWKDSYQAFKDWALSNGYSDSLTLDRIDNDGDYTPENCRWTTMLIQRHNQRRLHDWIDLYGAWADDGERMDKTS